ncbi:MAG: hypothetical protein AMXMBFR64_61640 [Myxococcales bacterium]
MQTSIELTRLELSRTTVSEKKARLGQFLTPATTASFMASLFTNGTGPCQLLDAGAGIGSLSAAFLERWRTGALGFSSVAVDAFEVDPSLHPHLVHTLARYAGIANLSSRVRADDFVRVAVDALTGALFQEPLGPYTHAILNPPYKKMHSGSAQRADLRRAGIETVNLYSAFVALAVALSADNGEVVAIIPRSFCNGPYYRPFRDFILDRAALSHIHLFDARNKAFREDKVLQENVILRLVCGAAQRSVTVTTSKDDRFDDLAVRECSYDEIVKPSDPERFIHIPAGAPCTATTYPGGRPVHSPRTRATGVNRTCRGLSASRASPRHARTGSGPATLPSALHRVARRLAAAQVQEAERDHGQRGDREVALSDGLLLRRAPLLVEGGAPQSGGHRL